MSDCRRARRHLWAAGAEPALEAWLARHLRACPRCAAEASRLEREVASLRAAGERLEPPDAGRLWARIEPQLPRRRRSLVPALVPVALLLALAFASALRQPAPPATDTTRVAVAPHPVPFSTEGVEARSGPAGARAKGPDLLVRTPADPASSGRAPRAVAAADRSVSRPAGARSRHHAVAASRGPAPMHRTAAALAKATASQPAALPAAPANPPARAEATIVVAEAAPAAPDAPFAAVVVVHAPEAQEGEAPAGYSFYRTESADPVSGAVTRVAVQREADALGRVQHVTIDYEVRAAAPGVAGGT